MPTDKSSLRALKNLISEVDLILETTPDLPQNRTGRSRELLRAAMALTNDLISQAKMPAAKAMGHIGGATTARKYGSEHFRELAGKRKTHGGGRPRKQAE
ncbi:MAG: hypothetical protein ABSG79_08435 [Bryobacteraceae bacterium]|jgi:hypothetical protein